MSRLERTVIRINICTEFPLFFPRRFLHICESADDLVMQSQMQRELGRRTGEQLNVLPQVMVSQRSL